MSIIEKVKQLREATGAGFKDCNIAIKESGGDLEKAIEILRVKGISKASKKMSRDAKEGVVAISGNEKKTSIIEVNCETDFVAKNDDFINFVKELSELNNQNNSDVDELKKAKMKNNITVEENLVALIAKIGEKITIRRSKFFNKDGINFSYVHNSPEKNIGKVVSIVQIEGDEKSNLNEIGTKLAMHVAASSPIAIDKDGISNEILNKELEIIKEELKNSGKKPEMIEKIASGKIKKFISDNTLLNQIWIMDTKKKVKEIIKEYAKDDEIKVLDFVRFKVGEGID
mgnify:CR=1 FL=1